MPSAPSTTELIYKALKRVLHQDSDARKLSITTLVYDLPKPERLSRVETQDAWSFSTYLETAVHFRSKRVLAIACVADGASSAPRSGEWARHLTQSFTRSLIHFDEFDDWYAATRDAYAKLSPSNRAASQRWYEVEFEELGSQATIGGLIVYSDFTWDYYYCGDTIICYLPIFRAGKTKCVPALSEAEFAKAPQLLNSRQSVAANMKCYSATFEPGDRFVITTDCFAKALTRLFERVDHTLFGELFGGLFRESQDRLSITTSLIVRNHLDDFFRFFQASGLLSSDDITIQIVDTHG